MYDIPTFERGQAAVECSLVRRSAERRAGGVAFELAPDDGGCACNLTLEPGKAVEAGLQSELDGLRQRSSIQCRATLTRILAGSSMKQGLPSAWRTRPCSASTEAPGK